MKTSSKTKVFLLSQIRRAKIVIDATISSLVNLHKNLSIKDKKVMPQLED
jgi:hypothetical protein